MKKADWPAPANISAVTTTRWTGASKPPFESNNLAYHVGDCEQDVLFNRENLKKELSLTHEPVWLNQTHTNKCIEAEKDSDRNADAAISRSRQHPLAIMTADCLPILLCDSQGQEIAAVHAGWKGLVHGIIENSLQKMSTSNDQLIAWIGPSICQQCYETGEEVYTIFQKTYPFSAQAFTIKNSKWLADLAAIAELILYKNGVKAVYQAKSCTFELKNDYFSYRREQQTGRMATLIWFNN